MVADPAIIVGGGAIGGIIYPLLGYFKAKRTDKSIKNKVAFDVNKFLQPVFYGTVTGAAGVILGPSVTGIPSPETFTQAIPAGIMGAVVIEKLLKAEKEDLAKVAEKVASKVKK